MTTIEDGTIMAERIQTELMEKAFSPISGQNVYITASIGFAQYMPNEEMKAFVHRVDQLMYQAKKRRKLSIYSELQS